MGISVTTQFVSTNDLLPSGLFMSGPPMNVQGLDTYHAWTLIGTCTSYLYIESSSLVFIYNDLLMASLQTIVSSTPAIRLGLKVCGRTTPKQLSF